VFQEVAMTTLAMM